MSNSIAPASKTVIPVDEICLIFAWPVSPNSKALSLPKPSTTTGNEPPSAVEMVNFAVAESYVKPVTPATSTEPILSMNPEVLTVRTGTLVAEP